MQLSFPETYVPDSVCVGREASVNDVGSDAVTVSISLAAPGLVVLSFVGFPITGVGHPSTV